MKGVNYIHIGYKFHNLVKNSILEMDKMLNRGTIIYDIPKDLNNDEIWERYYNDTAWNDTKIGIPLLFNFYHGVELILKGLITYKANPLSKTNHGIRDLLETLKKRNVKDQQEIIDWFSKYVELENNPFKECFKLNNLTTDKYYILLKYPGDNQNNIFDHSELSGQGAEGLVNYKEILKDINRFKPIVEKWLISVNSV